MSQITLWVQVSSDICDAVEVTEESNVLNILDKIRTNFADYSKDSREKLILFKRKRENDDIDVFSRDMKVKAMVNEDNFAGSCCSNPIFVKRLKPNRVWIPFDYGKCNALCKDLFLSARKDTFEALRSIHFEVFTRRKRSMGASWTIPLMDNLFGMGKSAFAAYYIRMYQNCHISSTQNAFLKEIKEARTISVNLLSFKFNFKNYQKSMTIILREQFSHHFVEDTKFLQQEYEDSVTFLKAAVNYGGPIFLVLDEIGEIFKLAKSLDEGTTMFWVLVKNLFKNWCTISKFYFVLIGCSPYVRSFPIEEIPGSNTSPYFIKRLPLAPLNSNSTSEVIHQTQVDEEKETKLYEFYNLNEQTLKLVSEKLFSWTNGVPRELSKVFCECNTFEKLMALQQPYKNWKAFSSFVSYYREEVDDLLNYFVEKVPVDLTIEISKFKNYGVLNQNIILHQIATDAGFTWKGETRSALLFISESRKHFILNSRQTLESYLENYEKTIVHTNSSKCWEWICRRRIVETFNFRMNTCLSFFSTPVLVQFQRLKYLM